MLGFPDVVLCAAGYRIGINRATVKDRHFSSLKEPSIYQIHIQGILDDSWGDYFDGEILSTMEEANQPPVTILRTQPMDQSALVGLINRLNGLGLRLLLVEQISVEEDSSVVDA